MPWQVPITVDGLEYPVTFNTEGEPTQQDYDEAVQQILSQKAQAAPEPEPETPGYLSQLGSALGLGYRQMKSGVGATFNALTGDTADVAAEMAEMSKLQREQQATQTPEDVEFMRSLEEAEKGFEQAQGPLESIGALAQYPAAVFAQPGAAFKTAVQSAPNALISGATSLAGYGLGGLVGGVAGIETGPGAILTGLAGATAGGALSNTLMEAGPSIFDVLNERTQGAASNMTADEIAAYLQQNPDIVDEGLKTGAIRGSVIGAVEALGVKGSGRLLTMPERAAARAVQKELMAQGVDVASKEAVDKALLDPALRASTKAVAETAKNQFSSAGNMARLAGASAIETGAAGAGELAAQAAAGQDISTKEAFLEMMGDAALSLPMAATTKAFEGAKYMLNPALVSDLGKASAENLAATGSTAAAEAQEGFNEAIELAMLPFTREDIRATEMPFTREDIRATDLPFTREDIRATQLPFGREDIRAMEMPFSREDIRGISTPAQVAEKAGAEVTPLSEGAERVVTPEEESFAAKRRADLLSAAADVAKGKKKAQVSPAVTAMVTPQPVETQDATRKITLEESLRQEPQDRIESREAEEAILGDSLLRPAEGEEEVISVKNLLKKKEEKTPDTIKAIHYSREPLNLSGEAKPDQDQEFGFGFYAMEPSDEKMWKSMGRWEPGPLKNEVELKPKKPLIVTPQRLKKLVEEAKKDGFSPSKINLWLDEQIRSGKNDAIIIRGFPDEAKKAATSKKIDSLLREKWSPVFPEGKTSGSFINTDEYRAASDAAIEEVTGVSRDIYLAFDRLQNQIFVPPSATPSTVRVTKAPETERKQITLPGEPTTATEGMVTPGGVATERLPSLDQRGITDTGREIEARFSPTERMEPLSTPDEQRNLREAQSGLAYGKAVRGEPLTQREVDSLPVRLPEEYIKQGDVYIYKPGATGAKPVQAASSAAQAVKTTAPGPSQTTAAEKQTPVPLREGTGAAGVVQSEPVEGSIPTVEKVSPETESESRGNLPAIEQIDRLVQSGAKSEEMDKFIKSLSDDQFNELVASEAFDVDPKLTIKPKDTYDSKRIKRRKFVDAVNASTKEVRKTAQQVFREEEAAAKKQQAGEKMRSKAIDSIIGASEKKKRKFGQVTNSDAIAAVAMLVSSKDVPGVLTTWTGTKEDFLRDPANQTADPEIYARIKAGELVEGFFNKGRAYVFLDGIGVSDEDMLRGEQMSVTPQVAAVRRVLLHESLVHRGIHGLPLRHRRLILNWVRQNSTPAELDDLAKLYTEYSNWRNSDYDFEALAEELLAKRVDSLTEVPKDGSMAKLMDILRQIWDFIVGYKREPTLSDLKSVIKLLKSGAEALANDRLKDGGEVKLSKSESPSSKAKRKNSLRVKMTREALTEAALNQATWRDWYEEHQETLDEFFGDYAQQFQDILSVTSQAASVKANVGLALKAFGQWHRGEAFTGFLPAVIQNLNRLRDQQQIQGQKISTYKRNNDGTVDEAVIDRHITRLLFGSDSPTKEQFSKAQKVLAEVAQSIGWAPRQVQAALWAHSIYLSGKTPESYGAYLKTLDAKGTLSERIGELALRGSGGDAANRGRGRYSPAGITTDGIQRYNVGESQVRFSRPQFSSDTSAAFTAGSEAARSSIYSERDMDIREAIRRAYEAMPKTNSVAVPIGELFAKTEELMPGVTQEEFSLVLQDLFEDNGAVLQEGDVVDPLTEQDRRYLALAQDEDANREELQRMVDEAAFKARKGRLRQTNYGYNLYLDGKKHSGPYESEDQAMYRAWFALGKPEAVARDDQGRIIPLSRRFDTGADIRGQINVTTPEGKRAGFVVVMPRAAKASRIKAEGPAVSKLQENVRNIDEGSVKADFEGRQFTDTKPNQRTVKPKQSYTDAAVEFVDSLQNEGNSLEDIAYSIQSPEFIEGLGIERDLSMQDAIGLEVRNRINNALRKAKTPSVKARLNKLNLSLSKFWQGIGSVKGQHLAIRQKLIADPRYRWMFIKDKAEEAMKEARENVATANITSTDDLTSQMNREGEKASEQAGQSVADETEAAIEDDQDAIDLAAGEETLTGKLKELYEELKDLIREEGVIAGLMKKAGSMAKASLSAERRNELASMTVEQLKKRSEKNKKRIGEILEALLGKESDAKTPEQKKTRAKRKKMVDTAKKRAEAGKDIETPQEGEAESSEEQVSKAERTAQAILKDLSERYSDPLIIKEKKPNVDAMRELYRERVKQGVGPNQMTEKSFVNKAVELGVGEKTAGILWKAAELEIDAREAMRQDKILQRKAAVGARADAQAHRIIFAKERLKRQSGFSGIESNANKDTIIKAFQEQVKTPISQDAFIARLRPLNVSETVAKRLFTAAEREKADLEAMEAFRMLEGPDALKNILREIERMRRGEEIPLRTPIPWRQLLSQKDKTVEEYRQRIFDAISANEAFQNLSDDKKAKLADLFSEAWESKRKDILERMLTNLINKEEAAKRISQKGAQALREQSQRLVEDINLGILDSDELMKRLAEKFGIKSEFTEEEKQKIDSLIDTLQDSTLNRVKRNKAAYDLLKTLSGTVKVPITKLLADLWVTNVLSGINTMTSIALAVSSGAFELTSGVLRIIKAAIANQKQLPSEISASFKSLARFLGAFPREANLAWQYLVTGDRAFLDPSMNDVLNDLNYDSIGKSVSLAERLAESDKLLEKTVGVWMRTVSRLLTALDSFNSGVTKSGAIPIVARQLELDPATLAKVEESMNLQNYKDRIIQRDFAGVAPKTAREKALVDSWAKDEMMADLDKYGEFTENADFFGQQGAMTLDPSGIGGMIYRLIKSVTGNISAGSDRFLAESQRKWQERGKSDSMDATRLALAYALQFIAYNSANLAGLRFARFAGNKFNQGLSFIPVIGMLRLFEADLDKTHVKGKDAFMDMIQRNQFAGVMMSMVGLAILKAIADEPDDEKRGWAFNGGWANLTPERKQQKLAAGEKEYTIRVGDKVFNYQNWPISSVLAAIGGLSDLIRYSPEQWNEKSIAGRLGSAAASGVFAASEIPALSQFQELFGSNLSSKDPNEKKLDRFSRVMAGWGGGFVPRILKDFDFLAEPTLKKYDTLWERTASHIPVYRRYVGDDYYDILGKPIERKIYPGSREFMEKPSAPEYKILGKLNSRGIWLTPANAEHRMVGKGRNRRRLTQEEADAYSLETGKGYRQMLLRYGQRALQMPTERARAFLSDKADEVRDRALKKVYRR